MKFQELKGKASGSFFKNSNAHLYLFFSIKVKTYQTVTLRTQIHTELGFLCTIKPLQRQQVQQKHYGEFTLIHSHTRSLGTHFVLLKEFCDPKARKLSDEPGIGRKKAQMIPCRTNTVHHNNCDHISNMPSVRQDWSFSRDIFTASFQSSGKKLGSFCEQQLRATATDCKNLAIGKIPADL